MDLAPAGRDELRGRPHDLFFAARRPELLHTIDAPAFRTASAAGDEVADLSKHEALVRMASAYFQPITGVE